MQPKKFNIDFYADTSDINLMLKYYNQKIVKGFTTNPTIMRKSEIINYEKFARTVLELITDSPVSFEVFSDDFDEMEKQALTISSWGKNVNIKIPITNTRRIFSTKLIKKLTAQKIKINITAVFTIRQIETILDYIESGVETIISIFGGRIADTGVDPLDIFRQAVTLVKDRPEIKILWASPRELFNIVQADNIGCHIITLTPELLNKLHLLGKDLEQYSYETVKMFYDDALKSKYFIK